MSADGAQAEHEGEPRQGLTPLLLFLRYVLPAAVVIAGAIVMAFGSEVDVEGGASIVSAGLAIFAASWLYRASVDGDRVRDEEDAARAYFDAHGRWPEPAVPPRRATRSANRAR